MQKIVTGLKDEDFNSLMNGSLIISIVMILVGVLVYFKPAFINNFIGYIVAILCIVSALHALYKFFRRSGAKLYSLNIVFSVLLLLLGIVILMKPSLVSSFLTVCTGLYLILLGSLKISYASWLKVGSEMSWLMTLVIGLMTICFGILLFINPFEGSLEITQIIGIFIILANVLDFVDILLFKKRRSEIVSVFW